MASLDDVDADLLETEEAIQRIEEQLQGLQPPRVDAVPGRRGADRVPGRWCRAGYVPRWRPATKGIQQSQRGTFGSASRFSAAQELEGDFLLNPLDDCLSTTTVAKGAKIYSDLVKPRQIWEAKKWLETMAEHSKCQEALELLQAQTSPSLSVITQAWEVLLAEEKETNFEDLDASTDAGSELPELLSVSSAASSVSIPGPGAYSPNYEVLRPSLAKGAPSFSRYSAREAARQEDAPESQDSTDISDTLTLERWKDNEAPGFTCPGGIILPPHTTIPRRPTSSQQDAHSAALRPLGPDPATTVATAPALAELAEEAEDPWSKMCATGRLEAVEKKVDPGPGDYDLPNLPGGPSAFFAPESDVMAKEVTPGPAQYHLGASEGLVYPRAPGGNFGLPRPDVMEHQQCPDYVANYDALEMNFKQVEPRAPSTLILPEASEEALHALELLKHRAPAAGTGVKLGPGYYQDEVPDTLQRLRPDRMVLPWRPRQEGVAEHLVGLYKHYTRFGRWRLDDRALLGVDDDLALRRNRPRAFIQPPHQLKRSWSAEDIWRMYLPPEEEPKSQHFARNLDFDEWQEKEKHWRWLAVRHFFRTRPSLRLSYSLTDLELVKDRAPEVDFSKAPGRSPRAEEDEVEGDVLVLDTETAMAAVQPRATGAVEMAKQLGRDDGDDGLVDDFEELVLSPKRLERRSSCFVDMAKESGRPPEPPWDPHIWAEESERVFCYQPMMDRDREEVLDLSPASAQRRLLKRVPTYDWANCLGRPGHDFRMPELEEDPEAPALLTNYEEPFVAPPRPPRPPPPGPGVDDGLSQPPAAPALPDEMELPSISFQHT